VQASIKARPGMRPDQAVELRARRGKFEFPLEVRRSHLSTTMTNALISVTKPGRPLMLFARYISRPTGERLADAGINFVDEAGNLNVSLGENHHTLILGKQDQRAGPEQKRVSAATTQVLFAFLVRQDAIACTVRDLAILAGISKTAAADARQMLLAEKVLQESAGKHLRLRETRLLQERFLEGYPRVLRPHLFIGRYRSQERDPDQFVKRFAEFAQQNNLEWALTGGAGAAELDRFYRGEETTLFIGHSAQDVPRRMALVPDRKGPVTLLRLFGPLVVLPRPEGRPTAHPWLLYAELLQHDDPRRLEAAEEIRMRYLQA
jgi:hypothetical protein